MDWKKLVTALSAVASALSGAEAMLHEVGLPTEAAAGASLVFLVLTAVGRSVWPERRGPRAGNGPGGGSTAYVHDVDVPRYDLDDRSPLRRTMLTGFGALAAAVLVSGCATAPVRKARTASGFCRAAPAVASALPDTVDHVCVGRDREAECRQSFALAALGLGEAGGYACERAAER